MCVRVCVCASQVVYHGPVTEMVPYFASIGYHCPSNFNPADFLFMSVLHAQVTSKSSESAYDFMADKFDDEVTKAKVGTLQGTGPPTMQPTTAHLTAHHAGKEYASLITALVWGTCLQTTAAHDSRGMRVDT